MMDIRSVIERCAMYKLLPQDKPSRVAIRNVIDDIANIMPVIAYEIKEEQREEITESLVRKLNLNDW